MPLFILLPKVLLTFAEAFIHHRGADTKYFEKDQIVDCEFMISRCEWLSPGVGAPSIYSEPRFKLTTASPWFMIRLCRNVMRFYRSAYVSERILHVTSAAHNTEKSVFCTTKCFSFKFVQRHWLSSAANMKQKSDVKELYCSRSHAKPNGSLPIVWSAAPESIPGCDHRENEDTSVPDWAGKWLAHVSYSSFSFVVLLLSPLCLCASACGVRCDTISHFS